MSALIGIRVCPHGHAKVAHFCSMKITLDVRDFAARQGISESEVLEKGMEVQSVEFVQQGAEVYRKV